jgi:hypothetical protein
MPPKFLPPPNSLFVICCDLGYQITNLVKILSQKWVMAMREDFSTFTGYDNDFDFVKALLAFPLFWVMPWKVKFPNEVTSDHRGHKRGCRVQRCHWGGPLWVPCVQGAMVGGDQSEHPSGFLPSSTRSRQPLLLFSYWGNSHRIDSETWNDDSL